MSVTSHQQHLLRQPEPASQLLPSAFTQSMMVSGFLFFTCHLMPPPAPRPSSSSVRSHVCTACTAGAMENNRGDYNGK